jgi:uncharacterized protein YoxC
MASVGLVGLCAAILAITVEGSLEVTPLPQGLLHATQPVREVCALHKVVVVFRPDYQPKHQALLEELDLFQGFLVKSHPLMNARLTRLPYFRQELKKLRVRVQPSRSRTRRALLDIIGTLGKELFGFSTQGDLAELKKVIQENRQQIQVVTHYSNKLVSIVNLTRLELQENRHAVNEIINSTREISEWINKINIYRDTDIQSINVYQQLFEKLDVLKEQVEKVEKIGHHIKEIRMNLEAGRLTEELLPLSDLESLRNSPGLPLGCNLIQNHYWYYSTLKVSILQLEGELVYNLEIPLVSNKKLRAHRFKSFPIPNEVKNVSLQLQANQVVIIDPLTGHTSQVEQCIGEQPLVCPPLPTYYHHANKLTCSAAIVQNTDVYTTCTAVVTPRRGDELFVLGINDYILSTWGTKLKSNCWNQLQELKIGVYRLFWKENCIVCTSELCIPSTVIYHKQLIKHVRWKIYNMSTSFTELSTHRLQGLVHIPNALHNLPTYNLTKLMLPVPEDIVWTSSHTSMTTDIIIVTAVLTCLIIGAFIWRKRAHKEPSSERAIPLTEPTAPRSVNEDTIRDLPAEPPKLYPNLYVVTNPAVVV